MIPFDQYMAENGRQSEIDALRKIAGGYEKAKTEYNKTGKWNEVGNTFDSFINKYNFKPLNFDGAYGNQCMDLMHYYCVEVLKLAGVVLAAPTAYQAWLSTKWDYLFTRVYNSWWNMPKKGDIIFWNINHVAVVRDAGLMSFNSFDQNWPAQGYTDKNGNFIGTGVCHIQKHNYSGVAGWMRKK